MPKQNDEPRKDAGTTPPTSKPGQDTPQDLDVDKEVAERVRGGRRMISPC